MLNFGDALVLMQEGKTLRRKCWHDPHINCTLTEDDYGNLKFYKVAKCQVAHYTHAKLGWHPHPNEILATDWYEVK